MSSSLLRRFSPIERWCFATSALAALVAVGGILVGCNAVSHEEAAYAEAALKSNAARTMSLELDRARATISLRESEIRTLRRTMSERIATAEKAVAGDILAGAPGTLSAANRNHLNIKVSSKSRPWKGQVGIDAKGHAVFDSVENGLRAAAIVLTKYYTDHRLDTLEGIVGRFCESNKTSYVRFLSENMGLRPDEKFNVLARLPELMRCMGRVESRSWLPERMFTAFDVTSSAYERGRSSGRPSARTAKPQQTRPQAPVKASHPTPTAKDKAAPTRSDKDKAVAAHRTASQRHVAAR